MSSPMTDSLRSAISRAYLADENVIAAERVEEAMLSPAGKSATRALAAKLVQRIRKEGTRRGGVDAFMQEYSLSSQEGVVLMCLAEALLRVPDAATADRLIKDKIGSGDWGNRDGKSDSMFVNASTFALMLTGRVVKLDDATHWDFDGIWRRLVKRSGEPVIRQAVVYAMRVLGKQFVLGRSITEAIKEARRQEADGNHYSFDMLGEAAHKAADAKRYAQSYREALTAFSAALPRDGRAIFERPSISVKLSALHPRYEWIKRDRVMNELLPIVVALGEQARAGDLALTIDAEESDRHDLMLDFFEALGESAPLKGWSGLGLAVQAYQKRALPTLNWLTDLARRQNRRVPVRLVKGAYWDTEIKRGQELGLADYPVFTRKVATDTSYIAGARVMLAASDAISPQSATHNAHTVAAIDTLAGDRTDFEYQRLHGMGEALHEFYREERKGVGTRIYAPVGSHEELLAYLVRRLLENGANTSFVNRLADEEAPLDDIIADPVTILSMEMPLRNPRIPLPADMLPGRTNSAGFL